MPRAIGLCLALLAAPALAFAQSAPHEDFLEKDIIHWVGPETAKLQGMVSDEAAEGHTRPMVMPFGTVRSGDCRMTKAMLVIRHDGTGEFDATTSTRAAHADVTWHTIISIYDANNEPLFSTGDFAGPEMNDGKPSTPYVWTNRFTMDPATLRRLFSRIDHAALSYSC
jgi:hypothetical protein